VDERVTAAGAPGFGALLAFKTLLPPDNSANADDADGTETAGSAPWGRSDLSTGPSKTLMSWMERRSALEYAARPGEEQIRPFPCTSV
jgi:hypothetical protein